jgi:chromosome partitioning protein
MTTYLVGNSKGGAGKTTTAGCVGALLASFGRRVCLLDTDVQRHLTEWNVLRRQYPRLAPLRLVQATGLVAHDARKLAATCDDIVIDAGGRDSAELRSAATVADVLLVPSQLGQSDLWALPDMARLVQAARRHNPKLAALAFVNAASTLWQRREHIEALRRAIGEVEGLRCASTVLHRREASFGRVTETGLAVFEMGRAADKAAAELWNLWAEVEALTGAIA